MKGTNEQTIIKNKNKASQSCTNNVKPCPLYIRDLVVQQANEGIALNAYAQLATQLVSHIEVVKLY